MTCKIITDQRFQPVLLEWLDERCPSVAETEGTIYTIAYVDAPEDDIARVEDVLTVCALTRWTTHTCEATLATNGAKRAKASREYIWTIFDYVFNKAGRSRLVTHVAVDNHKSIAVQHMLGMKQVAVLEDYFGEGKDVIQFGLTKRQWQKGPWATKEQEQEDL